MKYTLIALFLFIPLTHAQTYSERASSIDKFKIEEFPKKIKDVEAKIQEVADYKNQKMVGKDKAYIASLKSSLQEEKNKLESLSYRLSLSNIPDKLKQLEAKEKAMREYDDALKRKTKIHNMLGHSKRMKQFVSAVDERKYAKVEVTKRLLFKEEKSLALEYEKLDIFITQQSGTLEFNKKSIKELKNEIESKLAYPEKAISDAETSSKSSATYYSKFIDLKQELAKPQFDLKFSNWDCGGFDCSEKNVKLYRLTSQPDTILFEREGTVRCAINLTPELASNDGVLTKTDFAYNCKKRSMFGCQDNTAKELCQLSYNCKKQYSKMEGSFNKDYFFTILKEKLFDSVGTNQINDIINSNNAFFTDVSGEYISKVSKEKVQSIIDNVILDCKKENITSLSQVEGKTKKIIATHRNKLLKEFSGKGREAIRDVDYIFNSLESSFEEDSFSTDDNMRDQTYKYCSSAAYPQISDFCSEYKNYLSLSGSFMEKEEIANLTPGKECEYTHANSNGARTQFERVVLRPSGSVHDIKKYSSKTSDDELRSNVIEH